MANSSALSTVTFNSNIIGTVQSAQATSARATMEVTEIGDSNAKFIYGVITSTASLEVFFDKSDFSALVNQMSGATAALTLLLTWNTSETWSGSALVNSVNVTAAAGDVVKATIELQFTGAVTI
jgi:L-rhamnose isomerase